MNPDQIKQIVETIKTLNINFNDATTQKIADALIPAIKMFLLRDYISMGLNFIIFLVVSLLISKIAFYIVKTLHEEAMKE